MLYLLFCAGVSLWVNSVVAGLALCGSYDCKMPSTITTEKLEKRTRFITESSKVYMASLVLDRERAGLGFCFQ